MATVINHLESQVFGNLPSQPETNPKNVSAITLRSDKKVEEPKATNLKSKIEEKIEKEIEEEEPIHGDPKVKFTPSTPIKSNLPPLRCRLEKTKKQNKENEILEIFRKVAINIPLLDAIKQVPKYAQFLKNLCVNKKKLRGDEQIVVDENVSPILKRKIPPKYGDPDMFIIACKIGRSNIENVMLDLGDSINVMPKSFYDFLNLGPLKETRIIIQLADHTFTYPDGIVEDVLVQVEELIFLLIFMCFTWMIEVPQIHTHYIRKAILEYHPD
ncbi:uncharacterized protein LOC113773904 [Coffea eugenioides]|uniref:uncharacterized protein LOC113767669 n=1 Tax=Coffea eugenioides TaxID=49369 RepID=UPI000F60885B|nr:uncharacterized protein LOC113767669 [Coffea eugenioides]XP_027174304.1 uncharacterized protein LOC113773904 [Coffea eugenioides]